MATVDSDFCSPGSSSGSRIAMGSGNALDWTGHEGAAPQDAAGEPRIEFDTISHDFGIAAPGGPPLRHSFVLKNSGSATLVIDAVTVSCGCTGATAKANEVPPGGTTEIEVAFFTGPFAGPVQETIGVQTNDPHRPTAMLRIQATIRRPGRP